MDNGLLVRMDPKQWQKVLQTNLTGAFYCMREAARLMLKITVAVRGASSTSPVLLRIAAGRDK